MDTVQLTTKPYETLWLLIEAERARLRLAGMDPSPRLEALVYEVEASHDLDLIAVTRGEAHQLHTLAHIANDEDPDSFDRSVLDRITTMLHR